MAPMLCTGAILAISSSTAMYFLSSFSNASRLGSVAMNAAYSLCKSVRYRKSNFLNVSMYSITCALVPSTEPVKSNTDLTISLSLAIQW